jgi:hypothetical protein
MNVAQCWKLLVCGSLLAGAILIAPTAAAEEEFSVESVQGEVESVDIAANQFVVGGVRYVVALDADVEMGGNYAAFTMLTPGMKVEMQIHRYVDTDRLEVVSVKELPTGVVPKQY